MQKLILGLRARLGSVVLHKPSRFAMSFGLMAALFVGTFVFVGGDVAHAGTGGRFTFM